MRFFWFLKKIGALTSPDKSIENYYSKRKKLKKKGGSEFEQAVEAWGEVINDPKTSQKDKLAAVSPLLKGINELSKQNQEAAEKAMEILSGCMVLTTIANQSFEPPAIDWATSASINSIQTAISGCETLIRTDSANKWAPSLRNHLLESWDVLIPNPNILVIDHFGPMPRYDLEERTDKSWWKFTRETLGKWLYDHARHYSTMRNKETALLYLKRAIQVDPHFKTQVQEDKNFEVLWSDNDFLLLMTKSTSD